MKSLLRLKPFIGPYRYQILAGFAAFLVARLFEASTFLLVAQGIDQIAALIQGDSSLPADALDWTVAWIVFTVAMRFIVVVYARRAVRRSWGQAATTWYWPRETSSGPGHNSRSSRTTRRSSGP